MTHRTVVIGSPARLTLRLHQLVIARDAAPDATVPIEDLAILLLENPQITLTHPLLAALAEAKVATIVSGPTYLPAGVLLPFGANTLVGERTRFQLACSRPLAKRLWQAIVACKLRRQGELLALATGGDAGLAALARRVRSGDEGNLEAQGAQRYWPRLLGPAFRRSREGPPPNNLLNYGYAILRAATARALAGAGLLVGVGIFHGRRSDAFALASDLMEPFRPLVDAVAWEITTAGPVPQDLDRAAKTRLLAVLNLGVRTSAGLLPVFLAMQRAATSLVESFAAGKVLLDLPADGSGLPLPESDDAPAPPPDP